MAYSLYGIIGRSDGVRHGFPGGAVVELSQGMALLPLPDRDAGDRIEPWYELTAARRQRVEDASAVAPMAYVEAECDGGSCAQSAAVWAAGEVVLGPFHTQSRGHGEPAPYETTDELAIDRVLRYLGVARTRGALDEFDALELGRHRFTEEWLGDVG